jgi:hypothetical protein
MRPGHPQFEVKIFVRENLTPVPSPPAISLAFSRARLDAAREILAERGGRSPHESALTSNRGMRRRITHMSRRRGEQTPW